MSVVVGDVVRATLEMNYLNIGAVQNVFHLRNEDVTLTDEQALADVVQILEGLCNVLEVLIAVLQVVEGVRVVNVTQSSDVGFGVFTDTTPFSGVGQVTATQNAFGWSLFTSRLGVVGRKYWGVPIVGLADNGGAIASGSLAIMAAAAEDMTELAVATNSDWRFGVLATFDGVWLPFTSYSLTTTTITQRRRRAGVGV